MRWIQTGFVTQIDLVLDKFISKDDLDLIQQFKKTYITVTEAVSTTKKNKSYIVNSIRLGKLKVARTFKTKSGTVRFLDKSEVKTYLKDL